MDIIFVPGFGGGKKDMFLFKKILKNHKIHYFNYNTNLQKPIKYYSKKLKRFLKNINRKKKKIGIIGISAGGIIAEYCVKCLNQKVDKLIAVCSPFKGAWITNLFSKRKDIQDLKKGSRVLEQIKNSDSANEKDFFSYFDPLFPGNSGKGENPEHTFFFLHWIIQFYPPIIYKTKFIKQKHLV
jgi:esterase/lipase